VTDVKLVQLEKVAISNALPLETVCPASRSWLWSRGS